MESHSARLSNYLVIGIVFVFAFALLLGCGKSSTANVVGVVPGGGGGNNGSNDSGDLDKTLPDLTTSDLEVLAIDELASLHRSIVHLASGPQPRSVTNVGCLKYNFAETLPRFLVLTYSAGCTWRLPNVQNKVNLWQQGLEAYFLRNVGSYLEAEVQAQRLVRGGASAKQPDRAIFQLNHARHIVLKLPPAAVLAGVPAPSPNLSYEASAELSLGTESDMKGAHWELILDKHYWKLAPTASIEPGLKMRIRYRPRTHKLAADTYKTVELTADESVTFSADCHRPHGTFSVGTAQFKADDQGVLDVGTQKRSSWPTPCLEKLGSN